jgi:hypothetical protein
VLNGVLTFQHVSMPQAQFDHSVVLYVLIDCTIVITLILLHIYNTQNWGLVTYREVDLLIDEKTVSDSLLLVFKPILCYELFAIMLFKSVMRLSQALCTSARCTLMAAVSHISFTQAAMVISQMNTLLISLTLLCS